MGIDEMTWSHGYSTPRAVLALGGDGNGAPVFVLNAGDAGVHDDFAPALLDEFAAALPHHAGAELGILKLPRSTR